MEPQSLAAHEAMEVHELLNFKTVSLVKSKMLQGLVTDKDLRSLMQEDVESSIAVINTLQNYLPQAGRS